MFLRTCYVLQCNYVHSVCILCAFCIFCVAHMSCLEHGLVEPQAQHCRPGRTTSTCHVSVLVQWDICLDICLVIVMTGLNSKIRSDAVLDDCCHHNSSLEYTFIVQTVVALRFNNSKYSHQGPCFTTSWLDFNPRPGSKSVPLWCFPSTIRTVVWSSRIHRTVYLRGILNAHPFFKE